MRARSAVRIGAVGLAVLMAPELAAASPAFPDVVREELALESAPSCTLCHDSPSGGVGTATTAFATYLRSRGLQAGDAASLRTALAAARGERHDSDGDGISDVDQLEAGRDPSAGAVDAAPPPEFGCSAGVARSPRSSQLAEIIFVGLTMSWAARRRRRWAR